MNINVIIADKHALAMPHEPLVCGNNDYVIEFKFDEEWDDHPTKTARFIFDDRSYKDVVFSDNLCPVPVLSNTHEVLVGVFAGNLKTTTPAYLRSQRSVLCYGGEKAEVSQELYDQIMQYVNDAEVRVKSDAQTASKKAQEAIDSASAAHASEEKAGESERSAASHSSSASEHARNAGSSATVASEKATAAEESATRAATSESNVKASQTAAGESAQNASDSARAAAESAQSAGKSASDAAQSAKDARQAVDSLPGTLPNPHKLTLTGGTSAEYDGSKDVSVEIPDAYIVKVYSDGGVFHSDRSIKEIRAAVNSQKTCLLVSNGGRIATYCGEQFHYYDGNTGEKYPTFAVPVVRNSEQNYECYTYHVRSDGEVVYSGYSVMRTPTPNRLQFRGASSEKFDGSRLVYVDIPTVLPNPNKLTLTGAVTAEYDGSKEVTVNIPAGGGGKLTVDAEGNATI